MKRVSIAEAKQTLPALVHEVEQRGQVELTRRGKVVAYIVSVAQHDKGRRTFVESFEAWRERFAEALDDEPLELPTRQPARQVKLRR